VKRRVLKRDEFLERPHWLRIVGRAEAVPKTIAARTGEDEVDAISPVLDGDAQSYY
jgi:hypothetical protein